MTAKVIIYYMKYFNYSFFIIYCFITISCNNTQIDIYSERGYNYDFDANVVISNITLDCNNYVEPDNSSYENFTFEDLNLNDLNSSNIGFYHNVLLNDFFREIEYGSVELDDVIQHYSGLVSNSLPLSFEGFENINNLNVFEPESIWLPADAGFSQLERSYFNQIIEIINELKIVSEVQDELNELKVSVSNSSLTQDRKEIMYIGISIAKSSYKFWAPTELGGDDNERRIRCHLGKTLEVRGPWGEWFAKTVSADIIGGLTGAGRTAYLLAMGPGGWTGVLGSGLLSAGVSSTTTGIMSWP